MNTVNTLFTATLLMAVAHLSWTATLPRDLKSAAWNDATRDTIANARGCLPNQLPGIYLPMLEQATRNVAQGAETRLRCEELLLYHTYQRLSAAQPLCTAFAHGMRMCAYYLVINQQRGTTPVDFPRLSLDAFETACESAIGQDENTLRERFRHLFSTGTACLRKFTVNALIESFIE